MTSCLLASTVNISGQEILKFFMSDRTSMGVEWCEMGLKMRFVTENLILSMIALSFLVDKSEQLC